MATVGLSKPYYAIYTNNGGTVTYSGGGLLGKYTEFSLTLDAGDANILHADNGAAESDQQFSGGTATVTTDDLLAEVMLPVLGLKREAIQNEALATTDPFWVIFDDDQEIPYVGLGGVIKKKVNNTTKWVAFVLSKIQFSNPGVAAVTQGETIEWQTNELTANVMRSDASGHKWFQLSSPFDSEDDAITAIKAVLEITE